MTLHLLLSFFFLLPETSAHANLRIFFQLTRKRNRVQCSSATTATVVCCDDNPQCSCLAPSSLPFSACGSHHKAPPAHLLLPLRRGVLYAALLQSCCCRHYHPAILLYFFFTGEISPKNDIKFIYLFEKEVIFKSFHSPEVTNNKREIAIFFIFGFS